MSNDSNKTDPTEAPAIVELDEASILAVAGGLNPQPLPPRAPPHFD
jgi:hypothetical protein